MEFPSGKKSEVPVRKKEVPIRSSLDLPSGERLDSSRKEGLDCYRKEGVRLPIRRKGKVGDGCISVIPCVQGLPVNIPPVMS